MHVVVVAVVLDVVEKLGAVDVPNCDTVVVSAPNCATVVVLVLNIGTELLIVPKLPVAPLLLAAADGIAAAEAAVELEAVETPKTNRGLLM